MFKKLFPEVCAGGYTHIDGTVEFYSRVNALINDKTVVLDYGAGRGAWQDELSGHRLNLRNIKGKALRYIGCDVDEAVLENDSLDEAFVMQGDSVEGLGDESVDLVISDFTFEHISDPLKVSSELHRILRPGGWICARTPNKWSLISMATRLIKNKHHVRVLGKVQPNRLEHDIFPTKFSLNTMKSVEKYFPSHKYYSCSYYYEPEPSYYMNNYIVLMLFYLWGRIVPRFLKTNVMIFVRKL